MDDILVVMDVTTIMGLELVGSLSDDLGDCVGAFPFRTKLTRYCIFRFLDDLT